MIHQTPTVLQLFEQDPADYVRRVSERLLWDIIDTDVTDIRQPEDESVFGVLARATAILHAHREWEHGGLPQLVVVPWRIGEVVSDTSYCENDEHRHLYEMTRLSVDTRYLGCLGTFDGALLLASGLLQRGHAFSMDPAVHGSGDAAPWKACNTVRIEFL